MIGGLGVGLLKQMVDIAILSLFNYDLAQWPLLDHGYVALGFCVMSAFLNKCILILDVQCRILGGIDI